MEEYTWANRRNVDPVPHPHPNRHRHMRGPCESRISPSTLLSGFTSVQSRGGAQTEAEWEFQLALDTGAMTPPAQKLLLVPNRSRRALYDLPYHWMEQFVFSHHA